ncbi:MAG: hypothetical protein JWQ43_2625 [Glaciihabitans sp.]|nr:hypothetical protein [Glaciihabitans sp.]
MTSRSALLLILVAPLYPQGPKHLPARDHPGIQMKFLVVSHSCIINVNQSPFASLGSLPVRVLAGGKTGPNLVDRGRALSTM